MKSVSSVPPTVNNKKLISIINDLGSNATVKNVWFNGEINSTDILPGNIFLDSVSFMTGQNVFYIDTKCSNPLITELTRIIITNAPGITDTSLVYTSATNCQIKLNNCFVSDIKITINQSN